MFLLLHTNRMQHKIKFKPISTHLNLKLFFKGCHHHNHHHHVMPLARISLTLSRHFSLSFIAFGRSSGLHPVSWHICCIYVRAGRPAFAWPYAGVHRSTTLMSSSLLLKQCPACLARLTSSFRDGRQVAVQLVSCGMLLPGLAQYCSQHSCVIAV